MDIIYQFLWLIQHLRQAASSKQQAASSKQQGTTNNAADWLRMV
jgi:hypothetical protein